MNNSKKQTKTYEIKLQEDLSSSWKSFFAGLEFQAEDQAGRHGTTLKGHLDQSGLHGVLNQIRDLNLHLLSVCILNPISQTVTPQKGNCLSKAS